MRLTQAMAATALTAGTLLAVATVGYGADTLAGKKPAVI